MGYERPEDLKVFSFSFSFPVPFFWGLKFSCFLVRLIACVLSITTLDMVLNTPGPKRRL